MADRRKEALKEIAIAVAQSTVDAWLAGEIADDGQDTSNDKGTNHGNQHAERASKAKGTRKKKRAE